MLIYKVEDEKERKNKIEFLKRKTKEKNQL